MWLVYFPVLCLICLCVEFCHNEPSFAKRVQARAKTIIEEPTMCVCLFQCFFKKPLSAEWRSERWRNHICTFVVVHLLCVIGLGCVGGRKIYIVFHFTILQYLQFLNLANFQQMTRKWTMYNYSGSQGQHWTISAIRFVISSLCGDPLGGLH